MSWCFTNSVVRFGFNKSYVKKTGIDTLRPEFNAIYTFSASGLQDDIPEWYKKARRLGGYDAPTKNDPMVYIGKHWSDGTKKNFNAAKKAHPSRVFHVQAVSEYIFKVLCKTTVPSEEQPAKKQGNMELITFSPSSSEEDVKKKLASKKKRGKK